MRYPLTVDQAERVLAILAELGVTRDEARDERFLAVATETGILAWDFDAGVNSPLILTSELGLFWRDGAGNRERERIERASRLLRDIAVEVGACEAVVPEVARPGTRARPSSLAQRAQ